MNKTLNQVYQILKRFHNPVEMLEIFNRLRRPLIGEIMELLHRSKIKAIAVHVGLLRQLPSWKVRQSEEDTWQTLLTYQTTFYINALMSATRDATEDLHREQWCTEWARECRSTQLTHIRLDMIIRIFALLQMLQLSFRILLAWVVQDFMDLWEYILRKQRKLLTQQSWVTCCKDQFFWMLMPLTWCFTLQTLQLHSAIRFWAALNNTVDPHGIMQFCWLDIRLTPGSSRTVGGPTRETMVMSMWLEIQQETVELDIITVLSCTVICLEWFENGKYQQWLCFSLFLLIYSLLSFNFDFIINQN